MDRKDKRHPSGRPIQRQRVVGRPLYRTPDTGYVTPRLNALPLAHPIGFGVTHLPGHQDYINDEEAQHGR
jgi:hypothetical protein